MQAVSPQIEVCGFPQLYSNIKSGKREMLFSEFVFEIRGASFDDAENGACAGLANVVYC